MLYLHCRAVQFLLPKNYCEQTFPPLDLSPVLDSRPSLTGAMPLLTTFLLLASLHLVFSTGDVQFAFNGFAGPNLTIDDSATVTPDGLLMITNGTRDMKGHAMYPTPLQFHASPNGTSVLSFSSTFVFAILSEYPDVSAYGLAFFVAPSKNFSAALPSEYIGLFNVQDDGNASNHIFFVEFDTVRNVEVGDIDSNHVGINIDGLRSVKAASAGYFGDGDGAFHNLSLISGKAMQVWVEYDGQTMELSVTLAPVQAPKPRKPLLSDTVNLSEVITEQAYVGFTASLGSLISSRHCILGWSFALNRPAPLLDYSKLPKLPMASAQPNHRDRVLTIVLPIAVFVFVLTTVTAVLVYAWRRVTYAELREEWEDEFGPYRFLYKDLFHATNGFTDKQLLGVGGFGRVYKGLLPTSRLEIAVKRVSHDSRQGIREFIAEIMSIGRLRHRNLVQLLGYCRRKGELLLVYDYMSYGSLDKYLYRPEIMPTLDWATRFRIMKGVALGLCYLHDNCEQVVIHRDIKASNILLDDDMNGRLGDFGLARLYDHGADPQTTHIVGTIGYLAPELARTSKATPFTDVFAFGVFLLEVTCGRRPIEPDAQDTHVLLVNWVLEHWCNGSLTASVDARLKGEYDVDETMLVLKLGLLCSQPSPGARPAMRQVVQYLDGNMPLPDLPPSSPNFGTLALLQSNGLDSYVASYPTSSAATTTSHGAISDLSGGR